MFELYFTGLKYVDQAKKFRQTGHYQMSKARMTPGTSSMLRARRRDANAKPNRVLDKSSSRGMIYENEELRLRTININAEVEKGQHDIKKLRRENEQLRREIWTLREEYDRLESLLRKRQLSEEEGENSEGEEEEDEEEHGDENEENGEEEGEDEEVEREIDKSKLLAKLEFDELSVVEEEPEELEEERRNRSEERHEIPEIQQPHQSSVPKIQRPVPDIQISEVDGGFGGGENKRLTGADVIRGVTSGCHVEQRSPNGTVVNDMNGHYAVPNSRPVRVPPPANFCNRPRSDSLQKQNSIHPSEAPSNPSHPPEAKPQESSFGQFTHPNFTHPNSQPASPKSPERILRSPLLTGHNVVSPTVSDVLVDDAKVFQNLFERRAVLKHLIPKRHQQGKSDSDDKSGSVVYNPSASSNAHSSTNSVGAPSSSGGDSQECQLYVPPPQTLRLHCVQPFTLVFSVRDYEHLTVMDVIDILDEQLAPEVRTGLKGARIIDEQCYISFSNQEQVNVVLNQGIYINNTHIQLEDASIGTAVIALTGVPHDVDDLLVANILSSFGTILGSIERRMYKSVDTGERLIRLRPRSHIPSFIYIMGQRVTLRVLQPEEISCLRLRRRKSFRSQINLNIKLLDNDDIIIEPVVQPTTSYSEYHTMPSLSKRRQKSSPIYSSMPRISRQSPTPHIPDRPRSQEEPEYANILPSTSDVNPHTCRTIEISPQESQEQMVRSSENIDIRVDIKTGGSQTVQTPSTTTEGENTSTPDGTRSKPSLRIQTSKTITTPNDTSPSLETPATSNVHEKSVFDFNRKSSIKFDRNGESSLIRSSKIVHSPKISRKLSVYNPPETPNGGKSSEGKVTPGTPQTSGNETSSPQNSKKSPKRITKKVIKNIDGKTPGECSQSSSEGQESPTKHRKLLSMKGKKGVTRQASGEQTDAPTSPGEMTTTCSERERSYSDSSSIVMNRRKMSSTGREGTGKVPWCGCWGNGCL